MANKKIPSIKKNIEAFLTSEEGKISQKSALDLGIKLAIISIFACKVVVPRDAQAITSHVDHSAHSAHSDYSDYSDYDVYDDWLDHSDYFDYDVYDDWINHSDHSAHSDAHSSCESVCNGEFCG